MESGPALALRVFEEGGVLRASEYVAPQEAPLLLRVPLHLHPVVGS